MKSLGSSLEGLYRRAIRDRKWYADCIVGSSGKFARSLGKHFFYPRSRKRLRRPRWLQSQQALVLSIFFSCYQRPYACRTSARWGTPSAWLWCPPHRTGRGIPLRSS